MLLYYNAYVLPVFDNCMNIWGNDADVHIKKLQVSQNRVARVILNVDIHEYRLRMVIWFNV